MKVKVWPTFTFSKCSARYKGLKRGEKYKKEHHSNVLSALIFSTNDNQNNFDLKHLKRESNIMTVFRIC